MALQSKLLKLPMAEAKRDNGEPGASKMEAGQSERSPWSIIADIVDAIGHCAALLPLLEIQLAKGGSGEGREEKCRWEGMPVRMDSARNR